MITILDLMISERERSVKIAFNLLAEKQHGIRLLREIFDSLIANNLSIETMVETDWLESAYANLANQGKGIDYFILSYENGKIQMMASIKPEKKIAARKRKIDQLNTD